MKAYLFVIAIVIFFSCQPEVKDQKIDNPFIVTLNEPIDYKNVTSNDLVEYANFTLESTVNNVHDIKEIKEPTFENAFVKFDNIYSDMAKAMNNCYMLYWVSTDSLTRIKGIAGYQMLDSLNNQIMSDKVLFKVMKAFTETGEYMGLTGHRKKLVDDLMSKFEQSGVNLDLEKQEKFKSLNADVTDLTTQYSINMNTANLVLKLDEQETKGLPANFKTSYTTGDDQYEIPVMRATQAPVMNNAELESVRKAYIKDYYNRGHEKNLAILDQLIQKRYEIGSVMGYPSYAAYYLKLKMAKNPDNVWSFINDLVEKAKPKAIRDHQNLKDFRNTLTGTQSNDPVKPWNVDYYRNQLLKTKYKVDAEKVREYLPAEACLEGMLAIYEKVLGFKFHKVDNPSVWHDEVEMYEVYEGDELRGRFYLDLYPRPNKESWFYGVELTFGNMTEQGYEVPVNMLLGNFTPPSDELPSLLSHSELKTLFHEFGHIMDAMSYWGEFAMQASSQTDFVESMSKIFENWIWNYDILSSFARHYETGEILPKEIFENMLKGKNITSGLNTITSLRYCMYDMDIYDKYDPDHPFDTDALWKQIDDEIGVIPLYIPGTHYQACWIHINTHPVYYYGYLWSEVYAQDMFTEFEKNGLLDQKTGIRYRKLILANGSQRDAVEAVEEFLGRRSNNKAYIKSLGLD